MTLYAVMIETDEGIYEFAAKDLKAGSPEDAARKVAEAGGVAGNFVSFPNRNADVIPVELERTPRAVVRRKELAA